jgi:hypothetical protein
MISHGDISPLIDAKRKALTHVNLLRRMTKDSTNWVNGKKIEYVEPKNETMGQRAKRLIFSTKTQKECLVV